MTRIPLFPLNLVLFPGQSLPLHIFEERYKEMLQRCLRNQEPFGIVLTKDARSGRGSPHSIGTLARVMTVEEMEPGRCTVAMPHRDNCYHIMTRGEDRFRVTALDRREASYLVGDIELYPDESASEPALLMVSQRVAALFDEYYREIVALMGGWQREAASGERTMMFDMSTLIQGQAHLQGQEGGTTRAISVPILPEDPQVLANVVAAELNIQPEIKQELLEAPSALARLQREAEILAEETPQIEERLKQHYRRRFSEFGRAN